MFWRTTSERRELGAAPPVPLDLAFGRLPEGRKVLKGDELQRANLQGRPTVPADCGPIRLISRYGYTAATPGDIKIWRLQESLRWRHHSEEWSGFGWCGVSGAPWPTSESGFAASWLVGSEYAKIITGIEVLFDPGLLLYQGPLPNRSLKDANGNTVEVMAGLEYSRRERLVEINGSEYCLAELNAIVRLPAPGVILEIPKGTAVCWFFEMRSRQRQDLMPFPGEEEELNE